MSRKHEPDTHKGVLLSVNAPLNSFLYDLKILVAWDIDVHTLGQLKVGQQQGPFILKFHPESDFDCAIL